MNYFQKEVKCIIDIQNYNEKHDFRSKILKIINEIENNNELKNIFNADFLKVLIDENELWILPSLTKEEYFTLSKQKKTNHN